MISRKTFHTVTFVLAVAGLAFGAWGGLELAHQDRHLTHTAWAEKFSTPAGLARGVDVIAVVRPVAVQPGRVATSDNGEDVLPFHLVEMEVMTGIKGAATGETLLVERVGGVDPTGHSVFLDADGGDFVLDETYLVFLKSQADGPYFYQVNDQGRYHVTPMGLAAVDPRDVVAARFEGRTLRDATELLRATLRPEARRPGV
jgi:hypothetical protein